MSDPIFQRGLQDLIKGIRSHKRDPSAFISQAIAEIKSELSSTDPIIKAEAVRKLTYLQMTGYNVSWAAFAIVEVMSQSRFAHKRIGYLAANQSFDETTDVILLTTNLFKKEFSSNAASNNQFEIGLAINCLANIATKDLARDCISDLVTLMNHSKPYIRKKAVLAMYKLYVKYPQGLRLTFEKLKERLDDSESSVVSTAVNVICELANKNPKNYLAMAPKFFKLLTTSSNNWMLIKVVKLLGSLVSEEPRLARKLLDPMAAIIQNTAAKSLQFECIFTITEALPHSKREDGSDAKNTAGIVQMCSDYLKGFIEDNDQNLKYLGLVGLVNLMKSNPRVVVEHRDLVLRCLNDDDVTIRTKALELLAGIVSRKSLVDLVHHLLEHVRRSEGEYRDEIIAKIMMMCRREKYSLVEDFAWYTSILLELAVMKGSKHGKEVAEQLIDVSLRVDSVRPYVVESMVSMLLNEKLFLGQARFTVSEVLRAAAWIVGEYSDIVTAISKDNGADEDEDDENAFWIDGASVDEFRSDWRGQNVHLLVIDTLLHPRSVNLPAHVQSVYIQSAMKLFVRAGCDCDQAYLVEVMSAVRSKLGVFLQNPSLEVQERASTFRHLLVAMDILPLNWEESTEQLAKEADSEPSNEITALDLLDFPTYTPSSIKAVDDKAAQACQSKRDVLRAVIAENFYAVHSKAQGRVPVPEELNLEEPFNSSALNQLLSVEIDNNLTVQGLHFVAPLRSIEALDESGSSRHQQIFEDSLPESRAIKEAFETPTGHRDREREFRDEPPRKRDDVFILSSSDSKLDNGIVPLSKILGDNFQEIPSHKKRTKSSKSKKSGINVADLLPAGSEQLDDEKPAKSGKKKNRRVSDEVGLDAVDLSTPLRDDEVFATHKHREVPVVDHPVASVNVDTPAKKEKKSRKKDKDTKESAAPPASLISDELLGLEFGQPSSMLPDVDPAPAKKSKKSKGDSWLLLKDSDQCAIVYSIAVNGRQATLCFKSINSSEEGVSVSIAFPSSGVVAPVGRSTVVLASNLASGESVVHQFDASLAALQPDKSVDVPCSILLTSDSLLEPVSKTVSASLHLGASIFFSPVALDEDAFMKALSKSATGFGSSKTQLPLTSKAKTAFKAVAVFLNAHIVETEHTKAASLAARSATGQSVFVLLKASGEHIIADVKCQAAASRSDADALASEITRSLSFLQL